MNRLVPASRLTDHPAVRLQGNVGTAEAADLHRQALATLTTPDREVVVDCSELAYLGGAALQVLLAWQRDLAARSRRLILADVGPAVQATIRLAGSASLLPTT
jgi:anti-anti-sigma factor